MCTFKLISLNIHIFIRIDAIVLHCFTYLARIIHANNNKDAREKIAKLLILFSNRYFAFFFSHLELQVFTLS